MRPERVRPDRMLLGAYVSYAYGHHAAAWRHPSTVLGAASDVEHFASLARTAERGLFDFVFLADTPSVFNDDQAGHGGRVVGLEPIVLLTAIAATTTHLGLIATASTTYSQPYTLARQLATLDHVSGGRVGWNLVTSSKAAAAANHGLDRHPPHAERYERAEEFLDAVTALWDSWDDDALPMDRAGARYYDPARRHPPHFEGRHIRVAGELNVARPPQGWPVIVQAGASEAGLRLAARAAEIVFAAQSDLGTAVTAADALRAMTARARPGHRPPAIMPGISPYAAATKIEAQERFDELQALIHPQLGISMLEDLLGGISLEGVDPEGPLPDLPPSNGNRSRRDMIERLATRERLSVQELYQRLTVSRGHLSVVGSYDDVADRMADWFESGAADGFNVMPPLLPDSLDAFVDEVVPRLQRRGIVQRQYTDGTLRDRLGLLRPPDRSAPRPAFTAPGRPVPQRSPQPQQ